MTSLGDVLAGDGAAVGGEVREGPVLLSVDSLRPEGEEEFLGLEATALVPPPEGEGGDGVLEVVLAEGGEGDGLGDGLGAGLGAGAGGSEPINQNSITHLPPKS